MAVKTIAKAPAAQAAAAKATPPKPANTAPAAEAPPIPKTVDTFKLVRAIAEGDKLAPQARVIVNVIGEHAEGITREDLSKALDGKLITRQPIGRIVTYYQKSLVEGGWISIDAVQVG